MSAPRVRTHLASKPLNRPASGGSGGNADRVPVAVCARISRAGATRSVPNVAAVAAMKCLRSISTRPSRRLPAYLPEHADKQTRGYYTPTPASRVRRGLGEIPGRAGACKSSRVAHHPCSRARRLQLPQLGFDGEAVAALRLARRRAAHPIQPRPAERDERVFRRLARGCDGACDTTACRCNLRVARASKPQLQFLTPVTRKHKCV